MSGLRFWNQWAKPFRILYLFLLSVFFLVIITYLISYNLGFSNVIAWETSSSIQNLKYFLKEFESGIFKIQVPSFAYIIEENFIPGNLALNLPFAYAFLTIIFASLIIITTIITTLERTYFLVGFAGLIFSFLLFKFDFLGIFGIYEKYIFIIFLLFIGGLAYYFHAFRPDISFFKRLAAFTVIYGLIIVVAGVFAEEKQPLLSLTNYGVLFTGIISIVFIISVSHEIIYGFLFLVTYSAGPESKNRPMHFIVVSLLYFLCLFLIYFETIGYSDFQLFGTDAFLILPFSVLIGFYGLKAREHSYSNILSFTAASFLYITFAILCLSTLTYFFITYNDPAIEAFQDYIIFSHIGIGIIFFIYILLNFSPLLGKNLNVYKVAYKPEKMPFYMVRIGGFIFAGMFLFKANFLAVNQSISAYLNGIADLNIAQNDIPSAIQNFKIAKEFDNLNHKSNYSLAELNLKENKPNEAIEYLEESFSRNPSPQAFVKLSDIYLKNDLYFDAIYSLRRGHKLFPQDEHILNNLSLLYNKTAIIDSAYIFINSAKQLAGSNKTVNSNYWSFLARNVNTLKLDVDSIAALANDSKHLPSINNKLAFLNLSDKKFNGDLPALALKDTILSEEKFALLSNYSLNKVNGIDSAVIKTLDLSDQIGSDASFSENVILLKGILQYYNQQVKTAFSSINKLKTDGVINVGYYNLLLGVWALENKAYRLAVDYFNSALEKGSRDAFFYKAIALSELENKQEAISAWSNVAQLKDPTVSNIAAAMGEIISSENFSSLFDLNDDYKYQALRFKFDDLSYEQRDALAQTFNSVDYRIKSKLLEAEKAWEKGEKEKASEIIKRLGDETIENSSLNAKIKQLSIKIDLVENSANPKAVNEYLTQSKNDKYSLFFRAKINEENNPANADTLYKKAINALPFDYNVIASAVKFYEKRNKPEDAYNISLDAAQLNPYSPELIKLYIHQALNVNLTNYANDAMEKLKDITNEKEYKEFEAIFEAEKKIKESSETEWR